ncbi:hypothetical protein SAMD00019534_005980 [Acytostelium subglobosum LB1]|uniref:hypothetical protein n=1 Tax=Acytostelium subglobosum LB1 TaxID=1410327 RepID=UPI000644A1EC|nr:hypothetical protein SAMD00019534_005980 [Acytostelium subglobosum LB1]GAM17423.1 hypothetical protein SAMD00019534_005980 [Acytostelium subglobosum LB1]|eukprot:XP_012759485.1 hypothetical protein SAMD00019534_005980 [Acytostelium subglobosum LB1]
MEGKKLVSSLLKPRKSTLSSSGINNTSNSNLADSSSSTSTSTSQRNSTSLVGNGNGTSSNGRPQSTASTSDELTAEEYKKRNTRQIPAILLEDETEREDEEYAFDFERYYYESKEFNRETVRELVVIPDEVTQDSVQLLPKENRVTSAPNDFKAGANQHIDDCLDFYLAPSYSTLKTTTHQTDETPHTVVTQLMERRIEAKPPEDTQPPAAPATGGEGIESTTTIYQTPNVIIKSDEPDELHMGYLERQLRSQTKSEQHPRSLYSYFTVSDPPIVTPEPTVYPREKCRTILVDCKELVFKLWDKDDESEPFYCSLYLFDISKKVRVSELFHFDFNSEKTEKMLSSAGKSPQLTSRDELARTKKALFTIGKSSPDIYLVLIVEKILMGDLDDQAEPYIKLNLKDKEKEKLREQNRSLASRLGSYRQAFCWGCVPLFGLEGELGVGENTHFRPLYKYRPDYTDAQMLDSTLGEFSKSASTKKLKVIPGHCTVDIKELTNYYRTTVDPLPGMTIVNQSLVPLKFTQQQQQQVSTSPVVAATDAAGTITAPVLPLSMPADKIAREVQEFSQYSKFETNTEFLHNLYIYPTSVNLSNRSGSVTARNITVKVQIMENDDNVHYDGMKLIYGRSNNEMFTTKYHSSVSYHTKTPIFYDEVKVRLPITLTPQQHLLFTFYHITCQKSDKENAFDQPIGHAVLPIFQNGRVLADEVYNLPVALELPPKYTKEETEAALRYIDNKKPIFQVRTKLFSNIMTTDEHLSTFFNTVSNIAGSSIEHIKRAIKGLTHCRVESINQFFPVVMNQLFRLMTGAQSADLAMISFIVIGDILAIVNDVSSLVHQRYAKFVFTNVKGASTPVYDVLIRTWLELMRFQENNSDNILRFSKFFFSIIYKSMALHLIETRKVNEKTRRGRFTGLLTKLRKLLSILRWEATTRVKHTFKLSKELTKSLGTFISQLLGIADRGYVFSIIDRVVADFESSISSGNGESEAEIYELKFEFLRIIAQNEYFVQLNLPLPYRIDPSLKISAILSTSRHVISEMLITQVTNGLAHKEVVVRMDASNTLRDTLSRIEMDTRWQEPVAKQRIVGVFVPFLSSVVQNWNNFKDDSFIVRRNILVSFLYLLKSVHPNLLRMWWKEESKDRFVALFEILTTCADLFEFVGKDKLIDRALESTSMRTSTAKSILEDFYTGNRVSPYSSKKMYSRSLREKRVDARKSVLDSYNSNGHSINTLTKEKRGFTKGMGTAQKINVADYDDRLESNLAFEAGAIILDTADDFMYEFERELKLGGYYDVLHKVFGLLNTMLIKNQPITLVPKLYFTLRQFVFKFPKSLFELNNTFCSDLCNGVIRHCNSPNKTTREEASAFTFILMRKNYEQTRKNFIRTKTQFVIGLSKIAEKEIKDDYYLKKSLDTINSYANIQAEKLVGKSFAKQVEDLTKRMHTFVIDNIKISKHKDDPEMVADLYNRIADNNKSNADTRLLWLRILADFNKSQQNYAEAAQCFLHMAALVAEYLTLIGAPIPTIAGSKAFTLFNRNSVEESHAHIEREDDDNNQKYSLDYFMSLINDAILLLKDAELFELANLVYKLVLPVHEHNLDYDKLATCHGDLQDIFKRIVECTRTKSRMLGSYYRVAFFGNKFEELNSMEFVYKEPKITRLVEIKDRLRTLFAKKYSVPEQSIQIIEGSFAVDVSKLDPEQCYLQLTSVVPYFPEEEIAQRRTPFDHCIHLNRFMYETPFTNTGAGQGNSVADQFKQKTILTVQSHFPYTKKRIQVTSKQIINLSPIENAIESIEGRSETLMNEIKTVPPNLKVLQQVIQGSVRLQVNAGPQEICRTFLADGASYPQNFTVKLRKVLSTFLGTCAEALQLNRMLIDHNTQAAIEWQDEMESGYLLLLSVMEGYQVVPPEGSYCPANSNNSTPTLSSTQHRASLSSSHDSQDVDASPHSNNSPSLTSSSVQPVVGSLAASQTTSAGGNNNGSGNGSVNNGNGSSGSSIYRKSFTQRISYSFNKKASADGASPPDTQTS